MEPKVERQEVSATNPLQYKFTSYKAITDVNGVEFFVEDKVEVKNTLELDAEIEQLEKQKEDLQVRIDAIKDKQAKIELVAKDVPNLESLEKLL